MLGLIYSLFQLGWDKPFWSLSNSSFSLGQSFWHFQNWLGNSFYFFGEIFTVFLLEKETLIIPDSLSLFDSPTHVLIWTNKVSFDLKHCEHNWHWKFVAFPIQFFWCASKRGFDVKISGQFEHWIFGGQFCWCRYKNGLFLKCLVHFSHWNASPASPCSFHCSLKVVQFQSVIFYHRFFIVIILFDIKSLIDCSNHTFPVLIPIFFILKINI